MIDFHSHSYFSDGSSSPLELVQMAERLEISHLALTDHDTTAGLQDFLSIETKVSLVAGIEISADYPSGQLHIVGLFIDPKNSSLQAMLDKLQVFRSERNERLLRELSLLLKRHISIEDIAPFTTSLGRPHIASFLIKNGIAHSKEDAFERFLARGGVLYSPKQHVAPKVAIDTIKAAGGLVIIAHPTTLKLSMDELDDFLKEYKRLGVDGLEAYNSRASGDEKNELARLARKHELLISAGSDFHGVNGRVAELGAAIPSRQIEEEIVSELLNKAKR